MIDSEQEAEAAKIVQALRAGVARARAYIWGGRVTTIAGLYNYSDGTRALGYLDDDWERIDRLEDVVLERARNGEITWEAWTGLAQDIASDIETQASITGVLAAADAFSHVPADTKQTIDEYVDKAKDALPYVAAGVSGILILGIALFLLVEFGRRG